MDHHGKSYEHPVTYDLEREREKYKRDHDGNMWPDGMLFDDDEGVIRVGVGVERDRVMLVFPGQPKWVGMTPQQAVEFAITVIKTARKAGAQDIMEIEI